jgi:hypothetical protein
MDIALRRNQPASIFLRPLTEGLITKVDFHFEAVCFFLYQRSEKVNIYRETLGLPPTD